MTEPNTLIRDAYAAFNRRDIPAALALMTEDVRWPKASEGGSVVGKSQIHAYWIRQWADFDPRVDPIAITEQSPGTFHVRVHQLVKSLAGETLSDTEVVHLFTIKFTGHAGLIAAMHLGGEAAIAPSAAFAFKPE